MNISTIIKRFVRRAELNVAVAGAMVGSVAAMSKLFPTVEHYSTLKVVFYNGSWNSWDCTADGPLRDPWRDFLRWYHGRPQSAYYVMRHHEGSNMFRRCDLLAYDIRHGEREKRPSGDQQP